MGESVDVDSGHHTSGRTFGPPYVLFNAEQLNTRRIFSGIGFRTWNQEWTPIDFHVYSQTRLSSLGQKIAALRKSWTAASTQMYILPSQNKVRRKEDSSSEIGMRQAEANTHHGVFSAS
ncbi:hypothetical protein AVEN_75451-1 [Araneus ventricosus]|uniref:Uncharacterized protein n=1 Tax=Araneus ventricosus TaxID=182803 RepID=A0A4Y2PPQ0_ARAVE|nr:hypothetical protein AVEN_75451-1 [Araneus ventricosus]